MDERPFCTKKGRSSTALEFPAHLSPGLGVALVPADPPWLAGAVKPIPPELQHGPFTPAFAREHGVSEKMLRGKRFLRILPGVWRAADHAMSRDDDVDAARLALPARARLSHRTRIEQLGYDTRAAGPIHLAIAGDHHLSLPNIVLHRTEMLPPSTDDGVHPAAAWIQVCASATLAEAVRLGDFLLSNRHMTREDVVDIARLHPWRPGARQSVAVLPLLDEPVRSPRESDTRIWLVAAGLPRPESNAEVPFVGRRSVRVDLWLERWRHAIEVEGRQHFEDPAQVESDVHRYAGYRDLGISYTQVTGAMARQPIAVVMHIHEALVARGYDGPEPVFDDRWRALAHPIPSRGLRWAGDSASVAR